MLIISLYSLGSLGVLLLFIVLLCLVWALKMADALTPTDIG
jgi:hypothetical protein